ncbi:hypothetical protein ACVJGD_007953 [Bradyrhizobium sp. USDA 10063]
MNDLEKSDSAIVAMKSPNKAGGTVAEAMERRAGTKGNARQQSTLRTQGRDRVIQELDRVRQAARQRKKERFTALLHHINTDTLRMAFYALKRKAAPGVDGVTWQDFETDLEPRLADLHRRSTEERTVPSRHVGRTSRRLTAGRERWRSLPWRIKSFRARPSWCSTPSTKATSSASPTGFDPVEAHMMGWTPWR